MAGRGRAASHDDDQWPFTTHFTGCSFCTGTTGDDSASLDALCLVGFRRAYTFGDDQFLAAIGSRLRHPDFNTTSLIPVAASSATA